jgi:nicotinate-nucleotide adenylyltransferase
MVEVIMADDGIALFGGSFNPIHNGHLIVARAVAERLSLSRVVFIPSPSPPHKANVDLADASDRLEMVRLAIAGQRGFEASDFEVRQGGVSYTILTVEAFQKSAAGQTLHWIIGGDTLPELHTWYRVRELVERCRIVTAVRPGFEVPDLSALERVLTVDQVRRLKEDILPTPRIDISATDIRRRAAEGRSIRYLVPEPVRQYIEQRGLYRQGGSSTTGGTCTPRCGFT